MKADSVMVTGASGFVGRHLCRVLDHSRLPLRPVVRDSSKIIDKRAIVVDIHAATDWSTVLNGVTAVVHLAARVHVMQEFEKEPLRAFRTVNVDGTLNLARQAAEAGVKRFVFLSSIKVHGEKTGDTPFSPSDPPVPIDPYGISKLEAERGLQEIARATGLEVVIIRPPLVYGREAGGNFGRLRKLAVKGLPLPLGAVHNKRSLIGIENLCDCIRVCLEHPGAIKVPLLVSDNQDVSTPNLIRMLATSVNRSIMLPPVPVDLLRLMAKLCGREQELNRLTENLQVDCTETMRLLNWIPPVSLEQGIRRSVM